MKRIGILTYHSSINYGAFLQAYSLSVRLLKDTNNEVEIVNYTPIKVRLFYLLKVLSKIGRKSFWSNLKQYMVFQKSSKLLPLSSKLRLHSYTKQLDWLNRNYDALVIGSDEVLTAGHSKLRPFPNLYWPDKTVTIPKLVYAGSANRSIYTKLNDEFKGIILNTIANYKYIGVRDQHTFNQVKSINPEFLPQINCDPTFLFDFNVSYPNLKEKLSEKFKRITEKPIIVLLTKNNRIGDLVKKEFGKKYFILAVYYQNSAADYFFADLTPIEWAVAFSLYDGCVTQLFHGTVFCIKNNLPFISIDNNPQYDGRESKISDILKKSNLEENYFNLRDESFSNEKFVNQLKNNLEQPQVEKMKNAVINQQEMYKPFLDVLKESIAEQ